jgi:predicted nucleic acid-binding protein
LDSLPAASVTVIRVDPEDERRAEAIIRQYDDKDFSYVDATSFAIMERLGVQHAFAFDRHFVQFGFIALEPSLFESR